MPEYLHPGVYVEEVERGSKSIEGVSTSTAGFLGKTERGSCKPTFVTSFSEYERLYGGFLSDSYLTYAVDGFFRNGGKRCYISRIIGKNTTIASLNLGKSGNSKDMAVEAKGHGIWGNNIFVKVSKASLDQRDSSLFKLEIKYFVEDSNSVTDSKADIEESYDNLSPNPKSDSYYTKVVNGASVLINIFSDGNITRPKDTEWEQLKDGTDNGVYSSNVSVPEPTTKTSDDDSKKGGKKSDNAPPPPSAKTITKTSFNSWDVSSTDYDGYEFRIKDPITKEISEIVKSGLLGFEQLPEISIVNAPDENSVSSLRNSVVSHCEKMKDRFAIIQCSRNDAANVGNLLPDVDSKYAGLYMPWINIFDPITNSQKLIPPGGHIAGIFARSDTARGVHKAPANESVRGAISLQVQINKEQQDILNPKGINVIRSFPGRGSILWGARTVSTDPNWKYVNVRRLFLFIEKSIESSTQWVVFEPNNERLWTRITTTISNFLTGVWKTGALMGRTTEEAFFVRCDRTTMTQDDIDNGRLVVEIGIAPTKPAEFVIFRISQAKSGTQVEEI